MRMSKTYRVLSLMSRLEKGMCIKKYEEAERFRVDERTIQRDLDDIRAFLADQIIEDGSPKELRYDYTCQCYKLVRKEQE